MVCLLEPVSQRCRTYPLDAIISRHVEYTGPLEVLFLAVVMALMIIMCLRRWWWWWWWWWWHLVTVTVVTVTV